MPVIPLERRTGLAEVETGFTEEQARREASRCLQCWINTVFEGTEANGSECILCGGCVDVCPENCLQLVPLRHLEISESTRQQLAETPEARVNELLHVSPAELSGAEGSVMVKDETICIRCGLCAERCPVNTITMEAFEVFDRDPSLVQIEEVVLHS